MRPESLTTRFQETADNAVPLERFAIRAQRIGRNGMSIAGTKSILEEFRKRMNQEIRAAKNPKVKKHLRKALDLASSAVSESTLAENMASRAG